MGITITEALAEIKTIGKRLDKRRQFVTGYLTRQEGIKDPLEKDGGSPEVIRRERQAISDMENSIIALRRGIQRANEETEIAINGVTRSIADWLIWRRDVAPGQQIFLGEIRAKLTSVRDGARRQGVSVVSVSAQPEKPTDIVVNISETELAAETDKLEDTLGQLDGLLSLKNATIMIRE